MAVTVKEFKEYLKSLKFGGSAVDNTLQGIVDMAAAAAFGKVWEAHIWKVARRLDESLTTTASQAYTIMPEDLSGIGTLILTRGSAFRKISIESEGNFDYNYPYPAAFSANMPSVAKLVYHSDASNDKYRLYWDRVPDASYTLRMSYRPIKNLSFLPNVPGHMLEPMMLVGAELILPPSATQANQFSVARAAIADAIAADTTFSGVVDMTGGDVGWDDYSTSGGSGGSIWNPHT